MDRHSISEEFRKKVFDQLEKVSKQRHTGSYGPAEESFRRIAILWEAYWKCKGLNIPHTPADVGMLMSLFKMTREMYKHDFENILDGANYFCFAGGFNAADRVEAMTAREELFEGLEDENGQPEYLKIPNAIHFIPGTEEMEEKDE